MKLVYLGSPDAAVPPLRALVAAGHEVVLVVSQPDRRRGRGSALVASPVKAAAVELGLPVTDNVDDVLTAAAQGAELGVVVAYGKLIKPHLLAALPFVNIHFSLLPRWRGAAPVERALLAGDSETGVCLMELEEGLDTGGVYRRAVLPIGPADTAAVLRSRLADLGSEQLVQALIEGLGTPEPQDGEVTWARKLDPSEFEIDWSKPSEHIDRQIRVGNAWTTFRGKRLKIISAQIISAQMISAQSSAAAGSVEGTVVQCGSGQLQLTTVQAEGKAATDAMAWRNGAQPRAGEQLGAMAGTSE